MSINILYVDRHTVCKLTYIHCMSIEILHVDRHMEECRKSDCLELLRCVSHKPIKTANVTGEKTAIQKHIWGKQNKDTARDDFISVNHKDFTCGISPVLIDGFHVNVVTRGAWRLSSPTHIKTVQTVSWLECCDGRFKLKESRPYHVQMTLHLTDRQYCNFFVWSPYDSHHIRIHRDAKLWETMSVMAKAFHKLCMMPELLGKFFSRVQILQLILPMNTSSTATTTTSSAAVADGETARTNYCVCGGDEDGRK